MIQQACILGIRDEFSKEVDIPEPGKLCHSTNEIVIVQRTLLARGDFLPWLQSQGDAPISVTSVST